MAKRRERAPVNPLSVDLIAAAVAPVDAAPAASTEASPPASEKTRKQPKRPKPLESRGQKMLRARFPIEEFKQNEELTKALRKLMGGSKVTESDITRALWSLAKRAEEAMDELKAKAPKMARPANGNWLDKADYDDAIAHFLHLAIKKLGARE